MKYKQERFTGERPTLEPAQRYSIYEALCRYNFATPYCKNKKVLDIGCGEGFGTSVLADSAQEVIGIDHSEEAIDYANAHFKKPNLKFMKMDCAELDFEKRPFDLITAFEVIEHLQEGEKFLSETVKVLRDDGVLILSSIQRHTKRPSGNPFHVREYTIGEFKTLLLKYYKNIELFGEFCIRKKNPLQKFIMGLDSNHILRALRQRFNFKVISGIEKYMGTTPPAEVSEKDFIITRDNLCMAYYTVAICHGKYSMSI